MELIWINMAATANWPSITQKWLGFCRFHRYWANIWYGWDWSPTHSWLNKLCKIIFQRFSVNYLASTPFVCWPNISRVTRWILLRLSGNTYWVYIHNWWKFGVSSINDVRHSHWTLQNRHGNNSIDLTETELRIDVVVIKSFTTNAPNAAHCTTPLLKI